MTKRKKAGEKSPAGVRRAAAMPVRSAGDEARAAIAASFAARRQPGTPPYLGEVPEPETRRAEESGKFPRRIRNETAPPFPMYGFGAKSSLFNAADIPLLARIAGLPLVRAAALNKLAAALDEAFTMSLAWHTVAVREPAPQKLHDFLTTVESQACALLDTLRLPHKTPPGELDVSAQDWLLHLRPGIHGRDSPMFWQRAHDERYRHYLSEIACDELAHCAGDLDAAGRQAAAAAAANDAILAGVPTMLRTLAAAARMAREVQLGAVSSTGRAKKSGHPPSAVNDTVFDALCRVHKAMFGTWPVTSDNEAARGGPGVEWAKKVFALAARRLPEVSISVDPSCIAAVTALARLSKARTADLLAGARRRLTRPRT